MSPTDTPPPNPPADSNPPRDPARPPRPCPICGKPRNEAVAPFCSSRCRDRDLMRWLDDGYAIPGRPAAGTGPDDADAGEQFGDDDN